MFYILYQSVVSLLTPSYHSPFNPTLYILDSEGVVTELTKKDLGSGSRVRSSGAVAIIALR
jgi:hypothetical protein